MKRRYFLLMSLTGCLVHPSLGRAADAKPYDPVAFKAAQQAGESIVVQVHATW